MKQLIIATSLILLALLLDIFYGEETFQFSNSLTIYLQNKFEYGHKEGIVESIIIIFSTAGDAIVTNTLGILIWFKATNKEQILKLFTMNAIASSVGNIFKMISAQPRPYYIDDRIKLDFCYSGFGDPSGHSLRPFVFYVILLETLILKKYNLNKSGKLSSSQISEDITSQRSLSTLGQYSNTELYQELYPTQKISYFQCKLYMALFGILIGIGRLYFGVHFLNQIIIGWLGCAYLLYLYYYCGLEQFIEKMYEKARQLKDETICNRFISYVTIASMLLFIYTLTFVICYFQHYSQSLLDQKEEWKQNIIKQPTCLINGHYSYEENFETSDVLYISIIFYPLYLFIFHKPSKFNESNMYSILTKLWLYKENIIKIIFYLTLQVLNYKKKQILSIFSKGVPQLMGEILFDQLDYISTALFLLVLVPILTNFFQILKEKYSQQPIQRQEIPSVDIELQH